jgi:hypothetical protein
MENDDEVYPNFTDVNKYIHEFSLKSCKYVDDMSDLTDNEIRYWKKYLKLECGEPCEKDVNFFDENYDWCSGDIIVLKWRWTHGDNNCIFRDDFLTDIYSYLGDNQAGYIILGGKVVFKNNDTGLSVANENVVNDELFKRMSTLEHIRTQHCVDENTPHPYCKVIRNRLRS